VLRWLLPFLLLLNDTPGEEPNGDDGNDDEEEIRDPKAKIHSLEEANARLSKKIKAKDARISELEATEPAADELQAARIEAAFFRTLLVREEPIADIETAWDLASAKGYFDTVKIEDGNVAGMEEALDRLVERYPYLADEAPIEDSEDDTPKPGGRPVGPARKDSRATTATLRERFPALRRRR
jgi:hypothetical protein